MAFGKDALKKINDAPAGVESFKATLDALVDDQTISRNTAEVIKLAFDNAHEKKVGLAEAVANNPKGRPAHEPIKGEVGRGEIKGSMNPQITP